MRFLQTKMDTVNLLQTNKLVIQQSINVTIIFYYQPFVRVDYKGLPLLMDCGLFFFVTTHFFSSLFLIFFFQNVIHLNISTHLKSIYCK